MLRDIINKGNCGRDKARRMVAELVEFGYAEKEQARDGGRFSALSLVIYDEPSSSHVVESVASLPQTEKPSTVNPSTVLPSTVNPLVITDNLENTDCRSERARESDEDGRENRKSVERAFKRAFHRWPTAISDSEPDAYRAWCDLTPDERQSAFEEAQRYIDAAKATDESTSVHTPSISGKNAGKSCLLRLKLRTTDRLKPRLLASCGVRGSIPFAGWSHPSTGPDPD
ncbi:hypothetical protein HGG76_10445 [Ochrobactrum tritici]|uniref:Uncharacterized protein n=1 Tax=Brucella tritici TaxID=94626 RepID=A0A7X6JBR4_9HYPH|nr:hypothetical protein [Brucella tritici]